MWSPTEPSTGEQNHLMGNVSPQPRTLAWYPHISCPRPQLSSLRSSVTAIPINSDGSISRIVRPFRTQNATLRGSGQWKESLRKPPASSLLSSEPWSISLLPLTRQTMFLTRTKWSCSVTCTARWHFEIAWIITQFLALRFSKNLDHFYSRWQFFTIIWL